MRLNVELDPDCPRGDPDSNGPFVGTVLALLILEQRLDEIRSAWSAAVLLEEPFPSPETVLDLVDAVRDQVAIVAVDLAQLAPTAFRVSDGSDHAG